MVCGRPCYLIEMFALTFNVAGTHTHHTSAHILQCLLHMPQEIQQTASFYIHPKEDFRSVFLFELKVSAKLHYSSCQLLFAAIGENFLP